MPEAPRRPSAETTLLARSASGEEWDLHVRVWPPRRAGMQPWACEVEITRLLASPTRIFGEDAEQAQVLAMRFADALLQNFVARGGQLFPPGAAEGQAPARGRPSPLEKKKP